ncbi:hypothetical protein TDIS_1267 [Thermosulfurimonas dismutans]|uniref:Uncharacterized protein n=1 Tax=Thermosulfurimonas dismutans TaxID=999894 RepID=A0A179D5B6_9BACT|nr:hypothetical protein TDIS_1267 [Thermosulfurimonas dismutans]
MPLSCSNVGFFFLKASRKRDIAKKIACQRPLWIEPFSSADSPRSFLQEESRKIKK